MRSFISDYSKFVTEGAIFIPVAPHRLRSIGATVRFQLQISTGETALFGEGIVFQVRRPKEGESKANSGMLIKFSKLTSRSKKIIQAILTYKKSGKVIWDDSEDPQESSMVSEVSDAEDRNNRTSIGWSLTRNRTDDSDADAEIEDPNERTNLGTKKLEKIRQEEHRFASSKYKSQRKTLLKTENPFASSVDSASSSEHTPAKPVLRPHFTRSRPFSRPDTSPHRLTFQQQDEPLPFTVEPASDEPQPFISESESTKTKQKSSLKPTLLNLASDISLSSLSSDFPVPDADETSNNDSAEELQSHDILLRETRGPDSNQSVEAIDFPPLDDFDEQTKEIHTEKRLLDKLPKFRKDGSSIGADPLSNPKEKEESQSPDTSSNVEKPLTTSSPEIQNDEPEVAENKEEKEDALRRKPFSPKLFSPSNPLPKPSIAPRNKDLKERLSFASVTKIKPSVDIENEKALAASDNVEKNVEKVEPSKDKPKTSSSLSTSLSKISKPKGDSLSSPLSPTSNQSEKQKNISSLLSTSFLKNRGGLKNSEFRKKLEEKASKIKSAASHSEAEEKNNEEILELSNEVIAETSTVELTRENFGKSLSSVSLSDDSSSDAPLKTSKFNRSLLVFDNLHDNSDKSESITEEIQREKNNKTETPSLADANASDSSITDSVANMIDECIADIPNGEADASFNEIPEADSDLLKHAGSSLDEECLTLNLDRTLEAHSPETHKSPSFEQAKKQTKIKTAQYEKHRIAGKKGGIGIFNFDDTAPSPDVDVDFDSLFGDDSLDDLFGGLGNGEDEDEILSHVSDSSEHPEKSNEKPKKQPANVSIVDEFSESAVESFDKEYDGSHDISVGEFFDPEDNDSIALELPQADSIDINSKSEPKSASPLKSLNFGAEKHNSVANFGAEKHNSVANFGAEKHNSVATFGAEKHNSVATFGAEKHNSVATFGAEKHNSVEDLKTSTSTASSTTPSDLLASPPADFASVPETPAVLTSPKDASLLKEESQKPASEKPEHSVGAHFLKRPPTLPPNPHKKPKPIPNSPPVELDFEIPDDGPRIFGPDEEQDVVAHNPPTHKEAPNKPTEPPQNHQIARDFRSTIGGMPEVRHEAEMYLKNQAHSPAASTSIPPSAEPIIPSPIEDPIVPPEPNYVPDRREVTAPIPDIDKKAKKKRGFFSKLFGDD